MQHLVSCNFHLIHVVFSPNKLLPIFCSHTYCRSESRHFTAISFCYNSIPLNIVKRNYCRMKLLKTILCFRALYWLCLVGEYKLSLCMKKTQQNDLCAQWRLRSAWASAQSDQNICCPHEETLGPCLSLERTAKALIRLGGCPVWSESSLGAQVISLVLSCPVSIQCYYCMSHFTVMPT